MNSEIQGERFILVAKNINFKSLLHTIAAQLNKKNHLRFFIEKVDAVRHLHLSNSRASYIVPRN
jgi:hypothetical protein